MRRCMQLNKTTAVKTTRSTNLRLPGIFKILLLTILLTGIIRLHVPVPVPVVTGFKIVSPLFSTISLSSSLSSSASSTLLTSASTITTKPENVDESNTVKASSKASSSSKKNFHIDISWNIPNVTKAISKGGNTTDDDNKNILTLKLQSLLPKNGIILMDGFCPYHGGYIRQAILFNNENNAIEQQENTYSDSTDSATANGNNNNTTIVINVCSRYLEAIVQSQQLEQQQQQQYNYNSDDDDDDDDSDSLRIPSIPITTQQVEIWKEKLYTTIVNQLLETVLLLQQNDNSKKVPNNNDDAEQQVTNNNILRKQLIQYLSKSFTIRGVYCESDSGLYDAEIIRQLLQVQCTDTPTILQSRRNKFLLHETITHYFNQNTNNNSNNTNNDNSIQVQPLFTIPKQCLCTSINEIYDFVNTIQQQQQHSNSDDESTTENDDENLLPKKIVLKPIRGVASELVSLCATKQDIQQSFTEITSNRIFGTLPSSSSSLQEIEENDDEEEELVTNTNDSNTALKNNNKSSDDVYHTNVLVQEYIEGTEYAIDVVSCNGIHKIAAIWKYDKRPVPVQVSPNENTGSTTGSTRTTTTGSFCYYQTLLIDSTIEPINYNILCNAVQQVLDTLGIKYGITHTEFIIPNNGVVQEAQEYQLQQQHMLGDDDDNESIFIQKQQQNILPVLIEVNCRQHNMDFCPITMSCIGYNALDMVIDSLLLDPHVYDSKYPTLSSVQQQQHFAYGCMVHLVNTQYGILQSIQHIEDIYNLDSTYDLHIYDNYNTIGQHIEPTRDIRTDAGWVQLINSDYEQLQNDYHTIINQYMPYMFQVVY